MQKEWHFNILPKFKKNFIYISSLLTSLDYTNITAMGGVNITVHLAKSLTG